MEKQIQMNPVNSSNIAAIGWSGSERCNLYVQYKSGHVYMYSGVMKNLYDQLMQAESKGKFIAQNIKPIFPYTKLS